MQGGAIKKLLSLKGSDKYGIVMKRAFIFIAASVLAVSCGTAGRLASGEAASGGDPGEELLDTGYGKVKRKDNTGSISRLDMKGAESYTDIYSYIRGRVPGVEVRGTSITIRGRNSINSGTEPLILVDGVEINDLSVISPNMVESINVLKDASSSIYGVRGANGVIIITTRKADDGKSADSK